MHPVARRELEENREAIAAICRRYGIVRLWIFGSATGESFDPARSDFDLLAEYGARPAGISPWGRIVGFPEDLTALLGRKVDVVDSWGLANPFFRRAVEETRRELLAAWQSKPILVEPSLCAVPRMLL